MKKILIAIISLAVIAAGSVTAFLVVKDKKEKEEKAASEAAAENYIFNFSADDITSVSFSCDDGDYNIVRSESGQWVLSGASDSFDLDQDYIGNVCQYMASLTAETNFGDVTDENKAMYGLDEPDTVTVSDGTNDYTVYIGAQSPTNEHYYLMAEGKSKVYAVDALEASVLITSRMMMKDKYLLPYSDTEIHGIKLVRDGKTVYDLTYDTENSVWTLPKEYSSVTIDQTNVSSMINVMTRIQAQGMLDEHLEDLSKYGFDTPTAELTVSGSDGSERSFLFSYYGDNVQMYTHVLYQETGQVATFYTGDVDFIENTPADFVIENAYRVNSNDIDGMKIKFADVFDCEFAINQAENDFSCNGVSITDAGSEAMNAYADFYDSVSLMAIADVDVEAEPEYTEPVLTITYLYSDGTEALIELVTDGENGYYMFLNGEYNGIIISEETLTGMYSISYFYEKLDELIN